MKSNVRKIMEAKGITLRGLMEETGLANKTILSARKDDKQGICTCTLGTLDRIARALGVSPKDLFDDASSEINY